MTQHLPGLGSPPGCAAKNPITLRVAMLSLGHRSDVLGKPERIAGLLCILVWSLMVMSLMERQVRRRLSGKPMYGLYPENRPSPAPTGPALLNEILKLLDIDAVCLQTFKRRCGM
jgi:hypothetical protein